MTIPTLLAGQTAQLVASRVATTACYLNGWIDFNADGDWTDTGEQVATNVLLAAGNNNLAVSVPGAAANGTTYARFRCSTQQNLNPTGVSTDGEVEDYAVTVTGTAVDWGDLPDTAAGTGTGNYQTLATDNGARTCCQAWRTWANAWTGDWDAAEWVGGWQTTSASLPRGWAHARPAMTTRTA